MHEVSSIARGEVLVADTAEVLFPGLRISESLPGSEKDRRSPKIARPQSRRGECPRNYH